MNMRFAVAADLHITNAKPKRRLDDYFQTCISKFDFILNSLTDPHMGMIDFLLLAGDTFNSYGRDSYLVTQTIVERLSALKSVIGRNIVFGVYGQHDMTYHSLNVENTPLKTLESAGLFRCLTKEPIKFGHIATYGASFGQDIPEREDGAAYSILVTHRPVYQKEPWPGATGYDFASDLLKKNKFDLIITGDNHKPFTTSYRGKTLINCGSMMRSAIDQADHKPRFYIVDINDLDSAAPPDITEVKIPISDINEVMDLKAAEEEKKRNEAMEIFVNSLPEQKKAGFNFPENIRKAMKKSQSLEDSTKRMIERIMEKALQ